MEVHTHTHTERKKFTHYLWEFLMLFLAVFFGFLAEYQLEHKIESDKEFQFIRSLVIDLENDTITFGKTIKRMDSSIQSLDTLMHLFSSPAVKNYGSDLYYLGMGVSRVIQLVINDRTMQQLKNSGSFRLIRKKEAPAGIIDYYSRLVFLDRLQLIETRDIEEYRKMAIDIFQPILFDQVVAPDNSLARPADNSPLMTYDSRLLLRMAGIVRYIKAVRIALRDRQKDMNIAAKNLILLLKKEYHL